jgi:exopolysaccharide/PEP-CTERM locus tyrosine autokinase
VGKIFDALEKSQEDSKFARTNKDDTGIRVVGQPAKKEDSEFGLPEALEINTSGSENLDRSLITFLEPQSFEASQFKILRTNLLFTGAEPEKAPRTILVTSAVPNEGKSFVCANLAISISQGINEHVMVIDCDIRKGVLHRLFGFTEVPGLSEYLSSGTSVSSLLLKTGVDKLSLLARGKPPYNPSELLSSKQMVDLIEEVKDRYDDRYIIIDSPPPKHAAETSAMAKHVDGVLIVVEYGKTNREYVADMIDMVGKEKILGVVVNQVASRAFSSYGYGDYNVS